MPKLSLNTIATGYAAVAALNGNFDDIETAIENTLSRDGTTPNQMLADIDMNGYRILNLANPLSVEGATWRGTWATATAYAVNDLVVQGAGTYLCTTAHTSGTFATDLAANKWATVFDTTPATFVASGTGAVSRTIQNKMRDWVAVSDFGAVGDGVTDDTSAIQNALNSVTYGGAVLLKRGTYKTTGVVTLPDGVSLVGEGAYASVIQSNQTTGNILILGVSSELHNLKVTCSATRTAGYNINITGNGAVIDNCEVCAYFIGLGAGVIGGTQVVNPRVSNTKFYLPVVASGAGAMQFLNFSNANLYNNLITGPSSGNQPDFGVRFQNGDTAMLGDTNITLHGKALLVDTPANSNCYALTIDNCHFDSAGTVTGGTTVSSADIIPSGSVLDTRISNSWFGISTGKSGCSVVPAKGSALTVSTRARNGSNVATIVTSSAHGYSTNDRVDVTLATDTTFNTYNVTITVVNSTTFTYPNTGAVVASGADGAMRVTRTGYVADLHFTNCEFVQNGDNGLTISGTGVEKWSVTGSWAAGNTNYGISCADNTREFILTGNRVGATSRTGPITTNNYGIVVASANSDKYTIANNIVVGNTTAGIFDASTSTNCRITDNLGYNAGTVSTVSAGAGPTTTITAGHSPEMVYVYGGTVSSITVAGTQVASATNVSVRLEPHQAAVVTWSVAPTIRRQIQ